MTDEEYVQLALYLQATLHDHGFEEIAQFSNYEVDDDAERSVHVAIYLVVYMFQALNRLFATNDENVPTASLQSIRDLIDAGEHPRQAILHFDINDNPLFTEEPQVLTGITGTSDMRVALRELLLRNTNRLRTFTACPLSYETR